MKNIRFLLLTIAFLAVTNAFANDYVCVKGVRVNQNFKDACTAMGKVAEFQNSAEIKSPSGECSIICTYTTIILNRACEIWVSSDYSHKLVSQISVIFDVRNEYKETLYQDLMNLYSQKYGEPQDDFLSEFIGPSVTYQTTDNVTIRIMKDLYRVDYDVKKLSTSDQLDEI